MVAIEARGDQQVLRSLRSSRVEVDATRAKSEGMLRL